MIYYAGWLCLVIMSLFVSLVAFIWGLRSGQFSDQDRARYLPLGSDLLSQPVLVASRRKQRANLTALLVIITIAVVAFATALFLSVSHHG